MERRINRSYGVNDRRHYSQLSHHHLVKLNIKTTTTTTSTPPLIVVVLLYQVVTIPAGKLTIIIEVSMRQRWRK
ncbi:unnamed protein product [Trichobilharzia regenti]|nr:unnamed protein product [Trichobilharzia regenti]